jgi:hypothetical protein
VLQELPRRSLRVTTFDEIVQQGMVMFVLDDECGHDAADGGQVGPHLRVVVGAQPTVHGDAVRVRQFQNTLWGNEDVVQAKTAQVVRLAMKILKPSQNLPRVRGTDGLAEAAKMGDHGRQGPAADQLRVHRERAPWRSTRRTMHRDHVHVATELLQQGSLFFDCVRPVSPLGDDFHGQRPSRRGQAFMHGRKSPLVQLRPSLGVGKVGHGA